MPETDDAESQQKNGSELQDLQRELRDRLIQYCKRNRPKAHVAQAIAIDKISSNFEILVFGSSGVGKSELIRALSGSKGNEINAEYDDDTRYAKCYADEFGMKWWKTVGKKPSFFCFWFSFITQIKLWRVFRCTELKSNNLEPIPIVYSRNNCKGFFFHVVTIFNRF